MSKWVVDIHGDIEGDYEIIKEYKEQNTRWIPVTEKLPDTTDGVLAYDGFDMFVAWNWCDGKWSSNDNYFDSNTPIVAWMPLPQPYNAESEG